MRYHCLFRSRMAKADVLKRLLERNVSDGQWEGIDRAQILSGVKIINALREVYQQGVSVMKLLDTPGLSVFYREDTGCHIVEIDDTHFQRSGVDLRSQVLLTNEPEEIAASRGLLAANGSLRAFHAEGRLPGYGLIP